MYRYSAVSTLHGLIALLVGLYWAALSGRKPIRVAYVGAYITGAEVLWRMTEARLFWEFGKYAVIAIFIVAILRSGRLRGPALIFLYFALLIPSSALIVSKVGPSDARGYISFNMSGPLALMVSTWFFSRLKVSEGEVQKLFMILAGPIVGIAAITFFAISTSTNISFTDESNYVSSGGFGPNQVSAALGLGALVAFLSISFWKMNWKLKIPVFGVVIFLAVQSALTFSRGGLYNAAGATILSSFYLIRDPKSRIKFIISIALLFVVATYVLLPRLEAFTGGALSARFQNIDSTNRGEIILEDLRIWTENPILGAGPGGAKFYGGATAHTEFARLVAEHGIFGAIALLLLLISGIKNIKRRSAIKNKAIAVSAIGWSFLFMLNAAMRLVAPAFMFGLAFATLLTEEKTDPKSVHRHYKSLAYAGLQPSVPLNLRTKSRSGII